MSLSQKIMTQFLKIVHRLCCEQFHAGTIFCLPYHIYLNHLDSSVALYEMIFMWTVPLSKWLLPHLTTIISTTLVALLCLDTFIWILGLAPLHYITSIIPTYKGWGFAWLSSKQNTPLNCNTTFRRWRMIQTSVVQKKTDSFCSSQWPDPQEQSDAFIISLKHRALCSLSGCVWSILKGQFRAHTLWVYYW